uniref:Transposase n=1 Tax=Heterorhabditis bacteriophora TaxID=37862 RepID=A0A1I7W975_HETBA
MCAMTLRFANVDYKKFRVELLQQPGFKARIQKVKKWTFFQFLAISMCLLSLKHFFDGGGCSSFVGKVGGTQHQIAVLFNVISLVIRSQASRAGSVPLRDEVACLCVKRVDRTWRTIS